MGRPPKPGRAELHVSVPAPLREFLVQEAATNGISYGDQLAEILAARYARAPVRPVPAGSKTAEAGGGPDGEVMSKAS